MPRTVDEGFRDFLASLTPSSAETAAAKSHRESISTRLTNDFGMTRFFRIGSFGNGTSISGHSDVDYFAELPTDKLSVRSNYSLQKVRDSLDDRFPNTGVRVNCPAVAVPFGTKSSERHEVVPGDRRESRNGHVVYEIPDCANGWMKSSPEAHKSYVNTINDKFDGKVKPLIRFIKAWKYYRSVPISSFYIELRVAKYCSTQPSIIYQYDLQLALNNLFSSGLASMQDPMEISGLVPACKTDAFKDDALSKLETALSRATKALESAKAGNIADAFSWWRLLYDDNFPSYYY